MKVHQVSQSIINVCIAILHHPVTNDIFMASRPADKVMAGYWEFPGGKIEKHENSFEALRRELKEELDIDVNIADMSLIGNIEHSYPHGLAKLALIDVSLWSGELVANEGQKLHWQNLDDNIGVEPLLPTTQEILELLRQQRSF